MGYVEHCMTERVLAPSRSGSVVLDVGAGAGALVLHTPPGMDGREIEISQNGRADAPRTHSRVRQRWTAGRVRYAAVYPALAAGEYTVWGDPLTPVATVTVDGGRIASCHWPA